MPYFNTSDGCKLYYKTHDCDTSKPTVTFLNGTTQTAVYWEAHRNVFIDCFRLLMYDARAQGKSDLGKKELSLQVHGADLASIRSPGCGQITSCRIESRCSGCPGVLCTISGTGKSTCIVQPWRKTVKSRAGDC